MGDEGIYSFELFINGTYYELNSNDCYIVFDYDESPSYVNNISEIFIDGRHREITISVSSDSFGSYPENWNLYFGRVEDKRYMQIPVIGPDGPDVIFKKEYYSSSGSYFFNNMDKKGDNILFYLSTQEPSKEWGWTFDNADP